MDENIAIRITGLSKKYSISEKKTNLSFAGRLKEMFRLSGHKKVQKPNDFYALKNVNLEIKKGESVGIIGRNGAGKSTLLKILAEVVEPTEGTIEINGTVASVLEVGMGFHPELTGRENVFLSGAMMGLTKKQIAKQFDEIVAFSGVEKFIDQPVKHYSSGMYVRLAFAVVANINADILLFDEVLSVGDLAFQMKCLDKIKVLIEKGKTVLIVSHNINEIIQLCPQIIIFENGHIVKSGNSGILNDYYEKSLSKNDSINSIQINTFTNIFYKSWINTSNRPGDNSIRLNKIYIANKDKNDFHNFSSNDYMQIIIEYEKLNNEDFFDIGIILSNMNFAFLGSHTLISDLNIEKIKQSGEYRASLLLEPYFFNETILKIGFSISKNYTELVCFDYSVLQFKINLFIEENEKNYYKNMNKSFFPLRPKCNWSISRIQSEK